MRKLLLSLSLAGLMLTGASTWAHATVDQSQQQSTRTVAGKVTSIGNNGHSFGLEVNQGSSKSTMQFVVDKNAKIVGAVRVGTAVTVEYALEQGQNVALTVTAQG
jgi:hypothetical protein